MSDNFIKRNRCPVCESTSYKVIHSVNFSDHRIWNFLNSYYQGRIPKEKVGSDLFSIAKCNNCELLFQEYILNDANMFLLYEEWISSEQSLNKKKYSDLSLFQTYSFEIESIGKFFQKKPSDINILEYGMGWGFWLNLAKAYNFNVTGVEISTSRVKYAQQKGLKIIEDISQVESNSIDYIYSNQVFEHIPNPKETLEKLARILKDNGIIYIQVPNGKGIEKQLLSKNWNAKKDAIHPLEHINCFNRHSLKVLANETGFTLHPPIYRPNTNGIVPFFKSYLRHLYNLKYSTQVYLKKIK